MAAKNDVAVAGITSRRPGARVIIVDWATYLAVHNVDEAVRRVGEYGGTVTADPVDARYRQDRNGSRPDRRE